MTTDITKRPLTLFHKVMFLGALNSEGNPTIMLQNPAVGVFVTITGYYDKGVPTLNIALEGTDVQVTCTFLTDGTSGLLLSDESMRSFAVNVLAGVLQLPVSARAIEEVS